MGIQLTKGGRFNLSKEAPNLKNVAIALGWQVSQSGQSYDIDASVGKIQQLAEKVLALGCRFDDDGSIDIFLFGAKAHHGGEMTVDNFKSFIPKRLLQL